MTDAINGFRDAMRAAGETPPDVIEADGQLHRFHQEGDKAGSRNGYYVLYLDGRPAGMFGNWKTGRRARHEAGAIEARREWGASVPADIAHPYLRAKYVKPYGLRQTGSALLVPLFDAFGLLWNLQCIQAQGNKRFRPGRAGGLFSPIGDFTRPANILICEGWATGATLHEESRLPVLCAMNAGNLLPVASSARTAWPGVDLVICADNDRYTEGNPGVTYATAAAKATGAKLIIPEFSEGVSGSDFNDVAAIRRKGVGHAG